MIGLMTKMRESRLWLHDGSHFFSQCGGKNFNFLKKNIKKEYHTKMIYATR
jgi:hypothetical protein